MTETTTGSQTHFRQDAQFGHQIHIATPDTSAAKPPEGHNSGPASMRNHRLLPRMQSCVTVEISAMRANVAAANLNPLRRAGSFAPTGAVTPSGSVVLT